MPLFFVMNYVCCWLLVVVVTAGAVVVLVVLVVVVVAVAALVVLLVVLLLVTKFTSKANMPAKSFFKKYKAYTSAKVKTIEVVPCRVSIQQGHCELEDFRLAFPMESMESRSLGEFGCTDDGSFSGCFAHFAQSWNIQDL